MVPGTQSGSVSKGVISIVSSSGAGTRHALLGLKWFLEWNYQHRVCVCAQSCPTLRNPMDHSPSGSSVHGIFQARILEWIDISSSSTWYMLNKNLFQDKVHVCMCTHTQPRLQELCFLTYTYI